MRIFILYWGIEYEERFERGCFRTLADAKKAAEILKKQVGTASYEWEQNTDTDATVAWSTGYEYVEIEESKLSSFQQWKKENAEEQDESRRKAAEDAARWKAAEQSSASNNSESSDLSPEPHDLC